MRQKDVIAIFIADIHLSHRAPVARSAEPNWYKAMARQLNEVRGLQHAYDCPVVCAGDVFDAWNSPPELINFAIRFLPRMYAIPGQHDLPYHSYDDIRKSAYWTVVEAGIIKHVGKEAEVGALVLHPFWWGAKLGPIKPEPSTFVHHVAMVHSYVWAGKDTKFPGAPKESHITRYQKKLAGYNAVVFGDNHKGFIKQRWCNCGTFFRRTSDEEGYRPRIGLLLRSGKIVPHYLDCSKDCFLDTAKLGEQLGPKLNVEEFFKELSNLVHSGLDFVEAVKQHAITYKVGKNVTKILFNAIGVNNDMSKL